MKPDIKDRIHDFLQVGRSWYQRNQNTITGITIHHTADRQDDDNETALKNVYNAHVSHGWAGFAYHYFITKDGTIFQLNRHEDVTWHDTVNWSTLGVCLDGYFHEPYNEEPTTEQLKSLRQLLDWLCTENPQFPADHDNVKGHRDLAATACCGDLLYPKVKEYRATRGNVSWGNYTGEKSYGDIVKQSVQWEDTVKGLGLGDPLHIMADRVLNLVKGKDGRIIYLEGELKSTRSKLDNKVEELGRVEKQLLKCEEEKKALSTDLLDQSQLEKKLLGRLETAQQNYKDLDDTWGKRYGELKIEKDGLELRIEQLEKRIKELQQVSINDFDAITLFRIALRKFIS